MCVINIVVQWILRLMRPHLMEIPDEYDYCHFPRRGPFLSRFTILQTRVGGEEVEKMLAHPMVGQWLSIQFRE